MMCKEKNNVWTKSQIVGFLDCIYVMNNNSQFGKQIFLNEFSGPLVSKDKYFIIAGWEIVMIFVYFVYATTTIHLCCQRSK